MTTEVASAKKFCGDVFGREYKGELMGEMTCTLLKAGEKEIGGIMTMPPEAGEMPPVQGGLRHRR